jgi:hypothetical protein
MTRRLPRQWFIELSATVTARAVPWAPTTHCGIGMGAGGRLKVGGRPAMEKRVPQHAYLWLSALQLVHHFRYGRTYVQQVETLGCQPR